MRTLMLCVLLVGCGSPPIDRASDAGTDATEVDSHVQPPGDAGHDAGFDAGQVATDAGYDAGERFMTSAGGSIADSTTGLVWQAMDWGTSYTQANAASYCTALTLDGSSVWRLPTKDEVVAVAPLPGALAGSTFWTATPGPSANTYWYANFATGAAASSGGSNTFHARCVR